MIDFHAHIIPNIDDGAPDIETSFKIIEKYLENGVTGVVCTSHIEELTEENIVELERAFDQFKNSVSERYPSFEVYFGAEVSINAGILEKEYLLRRLTINRTGRYILIELPYLDIPFFFREEIYNLCIHKFIPIIAHPERNIKIIHNPGIVEEYLDIGALVQANTGSILNIYGKKVRKTMIYFLKHNLIQVLGSDVHNITRRPVKWDEALKKMKKYVSEYYMEEITTLNAKKILDGKDIIV